jgi:SAM-dependent methyltransferase
MVLPPETSAKLAHFESLEQEAAAGRVDYYRSLLDLGEARGWILDLGCGNGYAVNRWRSNGVNPVGVDNSRYRLSRWVSEGVMDRRLVLADAVRLPFREDAFSVVISSGMIEHVGVQESTPPYKVAALPDREARRAAVVREALRVTDSSGALFLDCPNGAFPIDFWHGDRVGAFRIHAVPDALLPTLAEAKEWLVGTGATASLTPIGQRLRFKQIASRWWGRLLRMPVRLVVAILDRLVGRVDDRFLSPLLPFLVLRISPGEKCPAHSPRASKS